MPGPCVRPRRFQWHLLVLFVSSSYSRHPARPSLKKKIISKNGATAQGLTTDHRPQTADHRRPDRSKLTLVSCPLFVVSISDFPFRAI